MPFVYGRLERTFCLSDFGGGIQRPLWVTFGTNLEPPKFLPLYSFTHDAPANLMLKSLLLNINDRIDTCEYLTLPGILYIFSYRLSA